MGPRIKLSDIQALPVADRLDLLEQIWDSVAASPETVPVPDWHAAELDRRLAAHADEPMDGEPWDDVKTQVGRRKLK